MRSQFFRFLLIGGLSTALHYVVLIVLTEGWSLDPVFGSTFGFIAGAVVNYYLNHRITFRSSARHLAAIPKFVVVASAGMILNAMVMVVSIHTFGLPYLASQIVATGIVLNWNFIVNRVWTYGIRNSVP